MPASKRLRPLFPILLLALLPLAEAAAQERGVVPEDYYELVFVGDAALAPGADFVAFTVTTVDEEENGRSRSIWLSSLEDGEPAGEPVRFTDPTADSWSPQWSPDGRLLAFQSNRGDGSGTWFMRTEAPGGEAYRIDGVDGAPIWSPDGEWIAFVADAREDEETDGEERRGWIAPDARTRTLDAERFDGRVITHMNYKRDGTHDLLPHPGALPKRQIHVVPAEGGEATQLTDMPFHVGGVTWSPDGEWLLFTGNEFEDEDRFAHNRQIYAVPREGGDPRRISPEDGQYGSPALSPDGERLAFLYSADDQAPTDLMVVPVGAELGFEAEPENRTGDWDLRPGSPEWTPEGDRIRFTTGMSGNRHVFEIPQEGGEVRQVTEGDRQLGSVSVSRDGETMAYTSTDPVAPAEVFVAAADGSDEVRVSSFNDAWIESRTLADAERVVWEVGDGTEVEGWVMEPVGYEPGGSYPMILKAHGGPHSMYGNTFSQAFHVLSNAGFFVLYPNPRGSSGYGHDFMSATRGEWGLVDEDDFLAGIDAVLERYPDIDPERIGVSGGSYGGYVTNWLTARSDRFAAAVTSRSIVSIETLYGTTDSGSLESHFFGPPWEERERYRAASPWSYVENVDAATLIIHSEEDHRTPMQDAEMWFMALKRRGVPVEMVRYPRSSHGLSRSGEPWLLVDRLERQRSWFEHWLIDEPVRADGAPGGR